MSKEIHIKDIKDQLIGKTLNDILIRKGIKGCKIVVTNDSTAAAFSGITADKNMGFDSYIGLIVGTGTNTAYIEKNSNN